MLLPNLPGQLVAQLNSALMEAFPSLPALRMMVRFECNENLEAIASAQGSLEVAVFELVERAIAYNWVDQLVIGARRRNPHHEQLRNVAEALGISHVPSTAPSMHVASSDLLSPHRFDLTLQIQSIADKMYPGQLVGFITYDNDPTVLRNLRQRLHDDLGRNLIYCYPTTLQVNELKQPSSIVLATILANARGRLLQQDVIFIISGLHTEVHLASFWSELQAALETMDIRKTLVVIFACESDVPPPAALHRLDAVHFTKADLRLWITKLVSELHWDANAIDVWFQTVLQCSSSNDELISLRVYDHLHFVSERLRSIRKFDTWQVELQQWSQYYV